MSKGPENRFIASVHRKLPAEVYREKMHNPYRGGTFDVWYSGSAADMWIEYKWIARIPRKGRVVPGLSELQLRWGRGRTAEGRWLLVVVGCPEGAVMLPFQNQWEAGVTVEEFRRALVTKPTLAAWIHSFTAKKQHADHQTPGRNGARVLVSVQDHRPGLPHLRAGQVPVVEAAHTESGTKQGRTPIPEVGILQVVSRGT